MLLSSIFYTLFGTLPINSDHILQFIIVQAHSIDCKELLFHAATPTYGVAAFLIFD